MGPGRYLEIVVGIAVVVLILYDLFHAAALPRRPLIHRLPRVSLLLLPRLWRGWRWVGCRHRRQEEREHFLAIFGSGLLLMMLAFWSLSLVLGYGLVLDGLRDQITPQPAGFWTSLYFSAATLLPLSSAQMVPTGWAVQLAVVAESASGVILAVMVIGLLFFLYRSFQEREGPGGDARLPWRACHPRASNSWRTWPPARCQSDVSTRPSTTGTGGRRPCWRAT
jgi:hypothetical protein